jgi:protein O-mannosyl-transferase
MIIRGDSRREMPHVCFLLLVAFAAYANSLLNGFIYDDNSQILNNPYVHSFRHVREIFTTTVWSFQGAAGLPNYYRPLMTFGYMLCWKISGPLPLLYHICNVTLNAAVVLLVYFLGRRLFDDVVLALMAAAIFAIHPVHTEPVAWIAGVADLELTTFYLIAFWAFLDLTAVSGRRLWVRRLLMGVSFSLALLSKEQAATLPVLATLYEHFYRDDRGVTSLREKASRYGTLWVLTGAYILLRARFVGSLFSRQQRAGVSDYQMLLSSVALIGHYAGKLIWPARLSFFYDFHKSISLLEPGVALGLAALLVCALLFVWIGMQRPESFAIIWMLVTLTPVLNIRWLVTNLFAERYLYLPSVGFCWLAAYGVTKLWRLLDRRPVLWRAALACSIFAIGTACLVKTVRQNTVWHDQETFIRQSLVGAPDDIARANRGLIYWNSGNLPAAEYEWLEALKVYPASSNLLENLALLRASEKRYPEAIDLLQRVLQHGPVETHGYLELGEIYEDLGRNGEAEKQYRAAVFISPLNVEARNHLGMLLLKESRFAEAEQEFLASVASDSTGVAYAALGDIYSRSGDPARAEWGYAEAISLEPFDAHAHFSLGGLYEGRGLARKAIVEYEAGLQLDPSNADARAALHRLTP